MKDTPEQNLMQYIFTEEQIAQADTAKLLEEDAVLSEYTQRLDTLRAQGVNKISALMQEIAAVRKNKLISAEEKSAKIAAFQKQIEEAKAVAAQYKSEDKELTRKAVQRVNTLAGTFEQAVKQNENAKASRYKQEYAEKVQRITEASDKKSRTLPPPLPVKLRKRTSGNMRKNWLLPVTRTSPRCSMQKISMKMHCGNVKTRNIKSMLIAYKKIFIYGIAKPVFRKTLYWGSKTMRINLRLHSFS